MGGRFRCPAAPATSLPRPERAPEQVGVHGEERRARAAGARARPLTSKQVRPGERDGANESGHRDPRRGHAEAQAVGRAEEEREEEQVGQAELRRRVARCRRGGPVGANRLETASPCCSPSFDVVGPRDDRRRAVLCAARDDAVRVVSGPTSSSALERSRSCPFVVPSSRSGSRRSDLRRPGVR